MKRDFAVSEISAEEYRRLNRSLGYPEGPVGGQMFRRKDFRMIDTVIYPAIADLLSGIDDDVQIEYVWMNDRPIGDAARCTRNERERYFRELAEKSGEYDKLVVQFSAGNGRPPKQVRDDNFYFFKESGVWIARRIAVGRRNFRHYRFTSPSGIVDLSEVDRVYGVFPRESTDEVPPQENVR